MKPAQAKMLLAMIAAIAAVVMTVTVVIGVVAYRRARAAVLEQVYRDSVMTVERLRT